MATDTSADFASVLERASSFPLAPGQRPRFGTAGFRGPAETLPGIAFRCGIVAALRCYATQSDCGLVITASHNPVTDNGVKFVDFNGEIFPKAWEGYAERLCEADAPEALVAACQDICRRENISLFRRDTEPFKVFLGHDSRPSSPSLLETVVKGVKSLRVEIAFESGLQTTPQVHYRVWRRHQNEACGEFQWLKYLSGGFMRMARGTYGRHGVLTVDCANGVAAKKLERLGNCPGAIPQGYHFKLANTGEGTLNEKCGAEYVEKKQALPENFDTIDDWQRCASVDGDADRVVYFTRVDGKTIVLDGDRIASLATLHVQSLLAMNSVYAETYRLGVALTAYSNQALVDYLKDKGIEVVIVPTGVKNLYAAAKEFDIGIFYEPNGHGSVIFSPRLAQHLREVDAKGSEDPGNFELLALMDTVNQTVGDGIANILMVEAVLRIHEWPLQEWLKLYEPLPSKVVSVPVENKTELKTDTTTETRIIAPESFQKEVDTIVAAYPKSRAFMRPSGTEDVVRIYAEASSSAAVDEIIKKLTTCVQHALKK